MQHQPSEYTAFLISATAALFIAFMTGGLAVYYKHSPYQWIRDADIAQQALQEQKKLVEAAERQSAMTTITPHPVIHKPKAFEGYTLYTTNKSSEAFLIDMHGQVVHRWSLPFSLAWPQHPQVRHPVPDDSIHWFGAHLFPNGDLLVDYEANGDTPYGYGMAKLDKDSKPIWHYDAGVNHVMDVDENGTIYALTHRFVPLSEVAGPKFPKKRILGNWVALVTPDGKEIKKISLARALARSPYAYLLKRERGWDMLHPNSVLVLRPEMAKAFPMFKAGQILVSLRNISTIGILDPTTETFVWIAEGPWRRQHDAEFASDGTIMLFDNLGSGRHQSRILKYDPKTKETSVIFHGSKKRPFFSNLRGMQQQLPNGNLMLVDAQHGRIIEVTSKGELVWQFVNPYNIKGKRMIIACGTRYAPADLPFLKESGEAKP